MEQTLEIIGTIVGLVYLWLEYRASIYPVSYTHLDVYKRQIRNMPWHWHTACIVVGKDLTTTLWNKRSMEKLNPTDI